MDDRLNRERLARHRARVDGILDQPARGAVWPRWRTEAAAQGLLRDDREALLPAVIAAAAERIETDPDDYPRIHFLDAEGVADEVVGRKLRVEPADACLMVLLAAHERCWYYEVRVALHLAERALADHPGQPDVLDALTVLRDRLRDDRLHASGHFAQKVRPWISRLLAEHAPGDLLDLSFIDQRCAWGRAAALAISHTADAHAEVGALALHLVAPRGTRASAAWWSTTREWCELPWVSQMLAELTTYLTTVELTPRVTEIDGPDTPPEHLVVPNNVALARGVMWAQSFAVDAPAAARVDMAVRRAAVPYPGWDGPTPRCSKVARAGILALDRLPDSAGRPALEELYRDLELPTLVRAAGKALGVAEPEIKAHIRNR